MFVVEIIILLVAFYGLSIVVDDFLVPAVYKLKYKFNWNNDQTGTALSFVSSSPELSLGLIALFLSVAQGKDTGSIGPATVIGSGLFSILFIVGLNCIFIKKKLNWTSILRDSLYYLIAVIALLIVVMDSQVHLFEAIFLLILFAIYFRIIVKWERVLKFFTVFFPKLNIKNNEKELGEFESMEAEEELHLKDQKLKLKNSVGKILSYLFFKLERDSNNFKFVFNILLSAALIMVLNYFMVQSASNLASALGIPSVIIALTILGAGTSIPDVLTSLKAAKEGLGDAAMVNNIGSPTFDLLVNLGGIWLIGSLFTSSKFVPVDTNNLIQSIVILFVATLLMLFIFVLRKWRAGKSIGYFLMGLYVSYIVFEILKALKII